jgi:hypothetical protein
MNTKAELMPLPAMPPEDIQKFTDWMWTVRQFTKFDPDVLTYPRVVMAKTTKGDEVTSFCPVHPVLMLESFAPSPTSSVGDKAKALYEIQELAVKTMQDTGFAETYFLAEDSLAEFALRHGWEEVHDVRVLKRKLTKDEREAWKPKEADQCELLPQ